VRPAALYPGLLERDNRQEQPERGEANGKINIVGAASEQPRFVRRTD
jgi:hypothetical protein